MGNDKGAVDGWSVASRGCGRGALADAPTTVRVPSAWRLKAALDDADVSPDLLLSSLEPHDMYEQAGTARLAANRLHAQGREARLGGVRE